LGTPKIISLSTPLQKSFYMVLLYIPENSRKGKDKII